MLGPKCPNLLIKSNCPALCGTPAAMSHMRYTAVCSVQCAVCSIPPPEPPVEVFPSTSPGHDLPQAALLLHAGGRVVQLGELDCHLDILLEHCITLLQHCWNTTTLLRHHHITATLPHYHRAGTLYHTAKIPFHTDGAPYLTAGTL